MSGFVAMRRVVDPYLLMLVAVIGVAAIMPAQGVGRTIVSSVTYAAVALLFFLYGARLSSAAVWAGLSLLRLQGLVLAMTYVIFPLLCFAAVQLVGPALPREVGMGLLFLGVLPSTVQSSIALTSMARGNVPAALCAASLSNLLGVVLTPLFVSLFLPVAKEGLSLEAVRNIALQILLPFAIGQLARRWVANWVMRHRTVTVVVDRGSILLVVYGAFSAGVTAGIWQKLSVADLGVLVAVAGVVLVVVLAIARGASRLLGFAHAEEVTAAFCGSQKSMASGIPMAAILFPASVVGLMVLPLMIYHQLQLFVGAMIARRYEARAEADQALTASSR